MTISSSLNAGIAGLNGNASRLATIADNIANSSTYGYKRAVTDFHSMVLSDGSEGYAAGGVRVTSNRLIDERGPLITTNNATDIAVNGKGMLPTTVVSALDNDAGSYPLTLMTTGSFRPDANGVLQTETGMVLMGWPAENDGTVGSYPRDTAAGLEPVRINLNQFAGDPTTRIELGVNLPASATEAGQPGDVIEMPIEYFGNLGTSQNLNISYEPIVPVTDASNTWTMTVRDSASNNAIVGQYTLVFNDQRGTGGTLNSVTRISGGAYDATTGELELNLAGGPMSVKIGALADPKGLTQLSDTFAPVSIVKDGSPVGNLSAVEVDANGFMHAIYDIGFTRTIYQIPLADVANPNGLSSLNNQAFQVSPESGAFFLWDAGSGPTGDMVGFAREESTTDVAAELTHLITTQRAYSSNAKVIQTVDEMLQETTNMKR